MRKRKTERKRRADASSSRAANKGDEEERKGLLTDSDGYHFIRDTILRLPQPTHSPSASPMPPTTDLIWSEPTRSDPLLARSVYLPPSSSIFVLSSFPSLHNTSLCLRSARVAYFYREDRHVHVPAKERHNYDLGIEHRSDLIVDRSYLKDTQHLWKFPVNSGLIGIDGTSIDGKSVLPRTR